MRPMERFETKRTGSMSSTVGPAVTSTVSPARSRRRARRAHRRLHDRRRPRPAGPCPASRTPGSPRPARRRPRPRARRMARFSSTAGCSNMLTFMAGATSTGAARREVERAESASSAMPARELAEDVGGGGGHQQQVGVVRQRDVPDVAARARAPTGRGTPGGARAPRTSSGATKRVAARRHHHVHVHARASAARAAPRRPCRPRCSP